MIDYFGHVSLSKGYCPFISFSEQTRLDDSNPWTKLLCGESAPYKGAHVPEYISGNYDTLFLAGLGWHKYLETNASIDKPVINLIQHVRHADPESDVYPFLNQRAIRICVAQKVTEAIKATDRVNGPVFTIPNGHSIKQVPQKKQQDIFILSKKNRVLGKELYRSYMARGNYRSQLNRLLKWFPSDQLLVLAFDELRDAHNQTLCKILSFLRQERAVENLFDSGSAKHLRELAEEAPVIELVNNIINQAIEAQASDIHIEPGESEFYIRLSVDGVLRTQLSQPIERFAAVAS